MTVTHLTKSNYDNRFESLYLEARRRENRLTTDEQLPHLPHVSMEHPHYLEWQMRAGSAMRFLRYLKRKNKPVKLLDLGCGNGWFTAKTSEVPDVIVTGIDLNLEELNQAARVFGSSNRLQWAYGDIYAADFPTERFDLINLAASIQYFDDVTKLLLRLLELLEPNGEIHIWDSPIYLKSALHAARARSQQYYADLGVPDMASAYFHHTMDQLTPFSPVTLFKPFDLKNRLARRLFRRPTSPFPWLMIRQQNVPSNSR